MITDKAIRSAIISVERSEAAQRELSDPSERGGGRLHLKVRPAKGRVTAEFYVNWQRTAKRYSAKLGAYPSMSLAEARRTFREQYLPVILKGENPLGPRAVVARGRGTVAELFEAYVAHLGDRPAATGARQVLLSPKGAANAIGPNRPAAAVRATHVTPHLAAIHDRGSVCQANNVRNIVHAAFSFGIRSANSYFDAAGARDWGLQFNPISAIPSNVSAYKPRDRSLSEAEVKSFWVWLEQSGGRTRAYEALRLELATGQRACEILAASAASYDRRQAPLRANDDETSTPRKFTLEGVR